jgi:hypothetical protein
MAERAVSPPLRADGVRHLAGFAQTNSDTPLAITHHHESAETEAPTALDHFGGTIDENNLLRQLAPVLAIIAGRTALPSASWSAMGTRRFTGLLLRIRYV